MTEDTKTGLFGLFIFITACILGVSIISILNDKRYISPGELNVGDIYEHTVNDKDPYDNNRNIEQIKILDIKGDYYQYKKFEYNKQKKTVSLGISSRSSDLRAIRYIKKDKVHELFSQYDVDMEYKKDVCYYEKVDNKPCLLTDEYTVKCIIQTNGFGYNKNNKTLYINRRNKKDYMYIDYSSTRHLMYQKYFCKINEKVPSIQNAIKNFYKLESDKM